MAKYHVGSFVYWAHCGNRKVQKQCPVCFGTKKVTLILGNEDKIELPCDYCKNSYEGPFGYITEFEYYGEPEYVKIDKVSIESTDLGDKVVYYYDGYCLYEDIIFDTKEEADVKCLELVKELKEEQITRAENIKKDKNKSYSWNAGYHTRETNNLKKRIEYHERMAKICKAKSKEENIS